MSSGRASDVRLGHGSLYVQLTGAEHGAEVMDKAQAGHHRGS